MRLVTFTHARETRIGLLDGEEIVDLRAAAPLLPTEMCEFLSQGQPAKAGQI